MRIRAQKYAFKCGYKSIRTSILPTTGRQELQDILPMKAGR